MTDEKRPTEILTEEHKNVLQKLEALEEVIDHLDKREENSGKLKELASFFNTDFWVHFAKEENALFPEIERFLPRERGPTGMMLAEHEDMRKTNAEIQPAAAEYLQDSNNSKARTVIQVRGTHFIGVLREHIYKEDNILFRMADMHFDQKQRDKVLKLFAEIEKSKGGG